MNGIRVYGHDTCARKEISMSIPKNYFAKKFGKLNVHKKNNSTVINLDFTALGRKFDIAQDALDAQIMQDMTHYMPIDSGDLINETVAYNMNHRGEVYAYPPDSEYGHYQYEGVLYVDPVYRKGAFYDPSYGYWSRKGVTKERTTTLLNYTNPDARRNWLIYAYDNHHTEWENIVKRALK